MNPIFAGALGRVAGAACLLVSFGAGIAQPLQAPAPRMAASSPPPAWAASGPPGAAPGNASITVAGVLARPAEFPVASAGQVKVAFECRIGLAKPQLEFSRFPRLRCEMDRARTVALNSLRLARADSFFSGDGMTTRTVMVYDKTPAGFPPAKIRAAFQLYLDRSATVSRPLLAEVVYADALPGPLH